LDSNINSPHLHPLPRGERDRVRGLSQRGEGVKGGGR